jgi:putative toxin-antitoxin system protein
MLSQKPLKLKISITIDEPLLKEIKHLAENDDRSVSQYINMVMRQYVDNIKASQD